MGRRLEGGGDADRSRRNTYGRAQGHVVELYSYEAIAVVCLISTIW